MKTLKEHFSRKRLLERLIKLEETKDFISSKNKLKTYFVKKKV